MLATYESSRSSRTLHGTVCFTVVVMRHLDMRRVLCQSGTPLEDEYFLCPVETLAGMARSGRYSNIKTEQYLVT